MATGQHVRATPVSLAELVGRPVIDQEATRVGRVADIVARWDGDHPYPPVTSIVVARYVADLFRVA